MKKWNKEGKIIHPSMWGKDHFSTLVYAETRLIDFDGKINNAHMRTDMDLHPELVHTSLPEKYPTVLYDGTLTNNHDDWSCLRDFCAFDFIEVYQSGSVVVVTFLDKGYDLVYKIRKHKCNGGKYSNFIMDY